MRPVWLLIFSLLCAAPLCAQEKGKRSAAYPPSLPEAQREVYKTVGETQLALWVFSPADHKPDDRRPAVVFFFGGGWNSGTPAQFHEQCKHFASRGLVAVTADYRVASRHQVKPTACVSDAKSAVRFLRQHAARLGIDPQKIAAGGGSAGGHLAACTGVVKALDESSEDAKISSVPNALILFNPALVLAPVPGKLERDAQTLAGLRERIGADPQTISPYHHVAQGQPPTIIFNGRDDPTTTYAAAELFTAAMKAAGNRCELVGYEGQTHGFFNYGRGDNTYYRKTLHAADDFLVALGWLKPQSK